MLEDTINEFSYNQDNLPEYTPNYFSLIDDNSPFNIDNFHEIVYGENNSIHNFLGRNIRLRNNVQETIIINAGVSEGKTRAIINKAYNAWLNDYEVIIACPKYNLISKYIQDLHYRDKFSEISKTDINDYLELKDVLMPPDQMPEFLDNNYLNKDFHVVTAHGLLGYSGEDSFSQAGLKQMYFDKIRHKLKTLCKPLFLIFDEIQECVNIFDKSTLFNLFRWKQYVHKQLILSATFTTQSQHISYLLTKLTDGNYKIFESNRKKRDNPADLHLIISDSDLKEKALELAKQKIDANKKVHIIPASKASAEYIHKELVEKVGKDALQLCVGGEHKRSFHSGKINIGTTILSGINMVDPDSCLIILGPSKRALNNPTSQHIFRQGYIAIEQALGRVRKEGEIYFISGVSNTWIANETNSINGSPNRFEYPKHYLFKGRKVAYKELNDQFNTINSYLHSNYISSDYNGNDESIITRQITEKEVAIQTIQNFDSDYKLDQFTVKEFILSKGDDYIFSSEEVYGRRVIPYLLAHALGNHFATCTLKSIRIDYNPRVNLPIGRIDLFIVRQTILDSRFANGIFFFNINGGVSERKGYLKLYEYFKKGNIYYDNKKLKLSSNQPVNKAILDLCCAVLDKVRTGITQHDYIRTQIAYAIGYTQETPLELVTAYYHIYSILTSIKTELESHFDNFQTPITYRATSIRTICDGVISSAFEPNQLIAKVLVVKEQDLAFKNIAFRPTPFKKHDQYIQENILKVFYDVFIKDVLLNIVDRRIGSSKKALIGIHDIEPFSAYEPNQIINLVYDNSTPIINRNSSGEMTYGLPRKIFFYR